jgi:hypothetical protein
VTVSVVGSILAVVAVWFLIFVGLHVLGFRSGRGNARWLLRSYAMCFTGTLASVVVISLYCDFGHAIALSLIIAALTSACLFVLYVPLVYSVLTSISVATLVLLLRNDGRMPEASLYDRFATYPIVEQRLSLLVANGYLVQEGSGFRPSPRGRMVARVFVFIKELWRLGPGG